MSVCLHHSMAPKHAGKIVWLNLLSATSPLLFCHFPRGVCERQRWRVGGNSMEQKPPRVSSCLVNLDLTFNHISFLRKIKTVSSQCKVVCDHYVFLVVCFPSYRPSRSWLEQYFWLLVLFWVPYCPQPIPSGTFSLPSTQAIRCGALYLWVFKFPWP